jgi:hypothetical protein
MKMSPDPLPAGVRWALRILRILGGLMVVPACMLALIVLISCLTLGFSGQLNVWQVDGFCLLAGFPVIVGYAVNVFAVCLEGAHSLECERFNPAHEWKKVLDVAFHGISLISCSGVIICLVALVLGKTMEYPVAGNWIGLGFHLIMVVASYYAPSWSR